MRMFNHLWQHTQQFKNHLLPCQLCQSTPTFQARLCEDCWQQLPWLKQIVRRQELEILAACHYSYPLDRMLHQFKYEQQLHFRHSLAGILAQLKLPRAQAIIPMPIAKQRLIERGYNQSLVLAQILARQHHLPIWQPIMRHHQHAQKGLSRLERLTDIDQQFHPITDLKQRYKRVIILDDVVTTGSSLHALTECLKTQLNCHTIFPICLAAARVSSSAAPATAEPPDV